MAASSGSKTDRAKAPIRILIVDDQLVVRAGLHMLIERNPGMKIVALASNRLEALGMAFRESLDLIILDLDLGGQSAVTFLPQLCEAAKDARVLVLTGVRDPDTYRQVIQLGAMGVVLKEDAPNMLIKAIEKVHAGEVWLDRATLGQLVLERTKAKSIDPEFAKIATLTARERQVIALIAEGLKNKQIARRLSISDTTARHHLSSIYSKLGVSDRVELLIYAFAHKIVPQPD
jgi:DNA-binding NarL/FixJ family response regulator